MSRPYRFAECELQVLERRLLIGGKVVPLGGRAFDVLRVLIEHHERAVPKDELLEEVWPGQDVEEGNLPVHISILRKLLGPHSIATVPGMGYRFALPLDRRYGGETVPAMSRYERRGIRPMSNLPLLNTPVLGREDDLATLERELPVAPILSVVGAAGIGKTRLALMLAQRQQAQFADGVWWVDLAGVEGRADLIGAIASVTGVAVECAEDTLAALLQGLRHRQMLVLLDNCEHLVDQVAMFVQRALGVAIGVHWLITSIKPLKLPLERIMRLPMLALPPRGSKLADALRYGALELLDERARASDRRFALTEATTEAAIDLCHQLDGNALAIEMAAARLPWMGVDSVRARLDDRLRLLAMDGRHSNARHSSLRAAMAWSHSVLNEVEQVVFRRLAVFHGGFTLDMVADIVTDGARPRRWDAIDALGALVDCSLVHIDGDRHAPNLRYRLLESARIFACEQLAAVPGERDETSDRHAVVFAACAKEALRRYWNESDRAWLASIAPERSNLLAGLERSLALRRADLAAPLYEATACIEKLLASGSQMKLWNPAVEELAEGSAAADASRLMLSLASNLRNSAPERAIVLCNRGLSILGAQGHVVERYRMHCLIAAAAARTGRAAAALDSLERARELFDAAWPDRLKLHEAHASGMVAAFSGDPAAARPHFQRLHALAIESGSEGGLNVVAHNLADIALALGETDEAVRLGRELVARLRREHDGFHLAFALGKLSAALAWSHQPEAVLVAAREALPLLRREDSALWLLDHLVLLAAQSERHEDAARLLGNVDAQRAAEASARDRMEQRSRNRAAALLEAALSAAALEKLRAEGARLSPAQIDRLALRN